MYLLKKVFELREKAHPDHEKPFLDHLEDLRVMMTRIILTLLVSMIVCFTFQKQLMQILRAPAEKVIVVKQQETMPDVAAHPGIMVPSVEMWDKAKEIEQIAAGMDETSSAKFFESLANPELQFHARSVTLLRAAKALPEGKREAFVKALDLGNGMERQLLALLDSDPAVEPSAGSNIRMMSALKPTETFRKPQNRWWSHSMHVSAIQTCC